MITQLVTYSGKASGWFDRAYYVNRHIPLALEIGRPCGLISMQAFFPASQAEDMAAVAVMIFRDEQSIGALFAAPRFHELVEDRPRYTDILPQQNMVTAWQAN